MTPEVKHNLKIEKQNPSWEAVCQEHSGSIWHRQWVDEDNDIHQDWVVYIGARSQPPSAEKFGFKVNSRSIRYRAFSFSSLHGAKLFANVHSIYLQDEEE